MMDFLDLCIEYGRVLCCICGAQVESHCFDPATQTVSFHYRCGGGSRWSKHLLYHSPLIFPFDKSLN